MPRPEHIVLAITRAEGALADLVAHVDPAPFESSSVDGAALFQDVKRVSSGDWMKELHAKVRTAASALDSPDLATPPSNVQPPKSYSHALRDGAKKFEEACRRAINGPARHGSMVSIDDGPVRHVSRDQVESLRIELHNGVSNQAHRAREDLCCFRDAVSPGATSPASASTSPASASATRRTPTLPFMTDPDLKRIAERDLLSLATGLEHGDPKIAVVFAGFVIEAVLLDVIESKKLSAVPIATALKTAQNLGNRFDPTKPESWKFEHIIDVCGPSPSGLGVLSGPVMKMADHVRTVRNVAHPANERRQMAATRLERADARHAAALVEKVIAEVDRFVQALPGAPRLAAFVLPWV